MSVTYSAIDPGVSLRGKTALVTGAASAVGQAIVEVLDELGMIVLAVDPDTAALRELVLDAVSVVEAVAVDARDRAAVEAFAEGWAGEPLHVLVNAVGLGDGRGAFEAARNACSALMPALRAGRAAIVNILPLEGRSANAPLTARVATGALVGYSQGLATTVAGDGLRVNAVLPGALAFQEIEAWREHRSRERVPGGRLARPSILMGPVVFLVSAMSRHVNGAVLAVDGGLSVT